MKKLYLLVLLLIACLQQLSAQTYSETEPNNSFATAGNMVNYDTLSASVGGADAIDYFKPDVNFWTTYNYSTGSLIVYVIATNTGASAARLKAEFFNGLQGAGRVVNDSTGLINPGQTVTTTFRYCGQYVDDFYFAFSSSTGTFDYQVVWYFSDPNPNTEANNTRPTASTYVFDSLNKRRESVNYQYRQIATTDPEDWFKTIVPAQGTGAISLKIEAKNNSCLNSRWIQYAVYKNAEATPLVTGYVGGGSSVAAYTTVTSTVPLGTFLTGDEIYIRIWSNAAFGYDLIYAPTSPLMDNEPNDQAYQATPLPYNQIVATHIGAENNDEPDLYDYFRVILPRAGAVRFYITGSNVTCPSDFNFVDLTLYDKNILNGTGFKSSFIGGLYWDDTDCDAAKSDSFTFNTAGADTFYLQASGYVPLGYTIRYQMIGDEPQADAEPNGTEATATAITASEVKKGNLGYWKAQPYDTDDYYKATVPASGNMLVYVKATYRGTTTSNNSNNVRLRLLVTGSATTHVLPTNPPTQIVQNTTYLDTFRICGVPAGNVFLRLSSSSGTGTSTTLRPYEYEIKYELEPQIDTTKDFEPDNSIAQARVIGSGQTREGQIGRVIGGTQDMNDYYRMVVPASDTFRIAFGGTNISCVDNRYLRIYGYNKNQNLVFFKGWILNAVGTVDAGQTVYDSLKHFFAAGDTVYIRFNADGIFNYWFRTNLMAPSPMFKIEGDSTVCEGPAYTYTAKGIVDSNITYHWSLPLGGGVLTATDSTASVVWNQSGNRRVDLYLSNARGNTITRQRTVIVNGNLPTAIPVITNFSRTLRTSQLPPGATCQWFNNGVPIPGATDSVYYAANGGSFTVSFVNDCGPGPVSNAIVFDAAAQSQVIHLTPIGTVSMSPNLKLPLTATASSGMRVFYQKISGPFTLGNDTLLVTGVGTLIVKASQPGDDRYSAAPDKFDTIIIVKGSQFITFDSIPDKIYSSTSFTLGATSSVGLSISYTVPTGNATVSAGKLTMKGAGTVTARASQSGSTNYNAATPVDRSFCVGVRTLTPIVGDTAPCTATYRYVTQKIPGANYVWTLSGGGILTTNKDTASVQWQNLGSYTLTVKANSPCDTVYSSLQTFTVNVSSSSPAVVTGMKPENFAQDQKLPLTLSWIPGANTVTYDLYIWDSTTAQPVTPTAANLTTVSYVVPKNGLAYNKTYKWRLVSKNPCSETPGPIQTFSIIPLPDLVVSDVQAPATANAGETITISWKVTNIGPGKTFTSDRWMDGVYFSLDTLPDFRNSPNWTASSWNALTAQGRPLLLGKKTRPAALDSGEFYTNSLQFTLPPNYSFPVYVYVIADNEHPNWKILQASVANDTARKQEPMVISIPPLPDLRIDTVTAPITVFSGSTVNLSYKVKNYGVVTPAGIGWTDSVFLSQNPLWDRTLAIPLMLPKADGSYYPNATNANSSNSLQLLPNATITKSLDVVIPNYLFGTWFIYVKTNADAKTKLYEGPGSENNINRAQTQIILTPTPKLTVNTLSVLSPIASTTQPYSINWNVHNDGFRDNIEKNKGHYFTIGTCPVRCVPSCPPNAVCKCVAPSIEKDSVVFGSSYWVDKVYISTDSTGLNTATARLLNETKHGTQFSGIYLSIINCPANYFNKLNVDNNIEPNKDYPKTAAFNLPPDLAAGTYYVYVYTNAGKDVFEYPGTPQIKRSAAIIVNRPDVIVSSIASPATAVGGQTVTINYSVVNNGTGSVFNHVRKDRLYISNFNAFDASATLLSTKTVTESIPAATSVNHSFTYQLPPSTSGARYFYVVTNFDSSFRETNSANNTSTAAQTMVSAAVPSDLTVTTVSLPDTVFTIFNNTIQYTVANNGTGKTAGTWVDSLFVSCSPAFNAASSYFVAERRQTRATDGSQSYSDTFSFAIPKMGWEIAPCFPQNSGAVAYFFIKTNADGGTYEGGGITNNVSAPIAKVLANPLVDHIIPHFSSSSDTVTVARTLGVQWTVKNIGYLPPVPYYQSYVEGIFISIDSVFSGNDVLVASYIKYTRLKRNDSIVENRQITIPNVPSGNYYLIAKTNTGDNIPGEKVFSNNTGLVRNSDGSARKVHIIQPLLPDLVDSILSAPASVVAGQPITVIRRITNRGAGVSYPSSWVQQLKLSVDFVVTANDGDRLLVQKSIRKTLAPGAFVDDTVTVTVPLQTVPGNYVLMSHADANGGMVESNENNNLGFSLLTVLEPPVVDLMVQNILHPDTVYLGYAIDTLKWRTRNNSPNETRGKLSEGIYLSRDNLLDSTAVLIGIRETTINLPALIDTPAWARPMVTGVVEGSYKLFVKTDLLNQHLEEEENNNSGLSVQQVYVKVKELALNVTENNTLHNDNRYYKLVIPDSLIGSTILVTLKSNDSLLVRNELYIGGGYVPSASRHDYKFEIPNYGNQQIVITDVSQPVYYIEVRCATPNAAVQNIQLKAVKLPFAILNVNSPSGGNSGNVTVKISGSLFTPGMTAQLQNGGTTINASQVYFTNSTQVFATFNLQGRPLGLYDVILKKGDTANAVLPLGFSIVPTNNGGLITGSGPNTGSGNGAEPGCDPGAPSGLNSQLVVELLVPPRVLLSRPMVLTINYRNPTNVDIPAQTRTLFSENVKLALTKEGVPTGSMSLYLEFTEPGGPPGIIRAGGSGTILIYTVAPRRMPANPVETFKLK